ncbi:MAG: hypothetical protein JSR18_12995 [Proteobacteria bacterium]|nr:hypothetical protein [Pseudomonadota bacterium]
MDDDAPPPRPLPSLASTQFLRATRTLSGSARADAPALSSPLLVERGADPATAIVAFTGMAGRLGVAAFDFLVIADLMQCSRVMLHDTSQTLYLGGLPPLARDPEALAALLRDALARLAPARTIFIGNSGGSHAALLYGHLLGADVVHALAPFPNLDPAVIRATRDARAARHPAVIERLAALPPAPGRHFDLRPLLARHNGRTRFNVHFCANAEHELRRAMHLDGLPGVELHGYPCDSHGVATWLVRQRRLVELLRADRAPAVAGR